jgi:DNA-binding MarR family transcriptional regulator
VAGRILRGAIVLELTLAARHANEVANRELRAAGVDPDEYGFLSIVGVLQPVTRTKLAAAIGVQRTTLRDAIRRLVERGHVQETVDPRDARASLLTLTPAGQAIFDRGLPAFHRALRAIDDALDGKLAEHEETVWRVRMALQRLVDEPQ